jgi:Ca2+-binding RTX toxin-like protein
MTLVRRRGHYFALTGCRDWQTASIVLDFGLPWVAVVCSTPPSHHTTTTIIASDTAASKGKPLAYVTGPGKDSFTGGFENDTVHAGTGALTFIGGSGNDTVYAGTGLGNYTAGSGTDLFLYSAAADSPFAAGSGGSADDTINGFLPVNDEVNLQTLLLSHKSVLDKGMVRACPQLSQITLATR